jgi:hypothetical protein
MSVTGARAYRGLRWVHRRRWIPAPSECRSDKGRTKGRHACNDQNIFEGDIHNDQIKPKFVGWVNVKLMAGWLMRNIPPKRDFASVDPPAHFEERPGAHSNSDTAGSAALFMRPNWRIFANVASLENGVPGWI